MDRPPVVRPPQPPGLVMFDFDGTVVDSLETYTGALLEACRYCGVAAISTPRDVLALFAGNVFEGMRQAGLDDETIAAVNGRSAGSYLEALARLRAATTGDGSAGCLAVTRRWRLRSRGPHR
jgi:phosphoglycolate phosphatase-like HAD superfamily hydrolase